MKILLVSGPGISLKEPYNSGIEAFMVSFANQLVNEGHVVDVIAEQAEADAKFTIINPFSSNVWAGFGFLTRLKEMLQFKKLDVDAYDIVHYNMFYPHLLEAGLRFNKTSFLTLHSPTDKQRVTVYTKLARQNSLQFVAISERIKRQWEAALEIKVPLINNGIDMRLWPTKSTQDGEYLLWSARINEEKNVVGAIQLAKYLQMPLKIAGRITDQQYFDENVKPHLNNQIEYVGHVTQRELSNLAIKASAYLATATWQEPFGLAALEMLASGVPIVGFDTAVPPDWAHESVLVTPFSRWQDLIELVKRSSAIRPSTCREFASHLNIQNMASGYVELYRRKLLQDDGFEDLTFTDSHELQEGVAQSQIVK